MEAFGFATGYQDERCEERLLNELPLLRLFLKQAKENYQKLFKVLKENTVDLSAVLGQSFYKPSQTVDPPKNRESFLRKLGYGEILTLTPRELDIFQLVSYGYPASFMAEELELSKRTVENYLASIKGKLSCHTKVELIQKAKEITAFL